MKIVTHAQILPDSFKNSILVIGNFDGMHQGHLALIDEAKHFARKHHKPVGVLTFEPHPREVFQPHDSPFRITPAPLKREKMSETGIDFMIELEFTRTLAQKTAQDFIDDILIKNIGAHHIFIGEDFRFGQNRAGSLDTLKAHGLGVTAIDVLEDEQAQKYSASQVRSYLRRGMIEQANQILGWAWCIRGCVIHGDKRGRELGYPTANVRLGETLHPAFGVYATYVRIEGETQWCAGATNIGVRPMFETKDALVEAHIFDFDEDLYGKTLYIQPIKKIREEFSFNSLSELVKQIDQDCADIKTILSTHPPS